MSCGAGLDPISVACNQGHKPIHWKVRRPGDDEIYISLT